VGHAIRREVDEAHHARRRHRTQTRDPSIEREVHTPLKNKSGMRSTRMPLAQ